MLVLRTNLGDITLTLDTENTPKTAENFLSYVKSGHYENCVFHRVIDGFMIQGGGFAPGMEEKSTGESIDNEADKGGSNAKGTIAMARTSDPHSASAQFFINLKDNTFLDHRAKTPDAWGYCVFGQVTEGMDIVNKIAKVKTGNKAGHQDVPVEDVIIEAVQLVETTQ